MSEYFKINTPRVIHEVIDGEAVIVNLEKGSYYSMDRLGAAIWSLIENGKSVTQIVGAISSRNGDNRREVADGVEQLLVELQQESLIVPSTLDEFSIGPDSPLPASSEGFDKVPFERPVLHKYTDMEDLLLLDPIHDVDETGWPNVPEGVQGAR